MKDLEDSIDITLIRQYLLGLLELTKQEELEQRLLTDEAFLDEVLIEEDELVDDFLNKRLSPDEEVSFRKFFLSAPERQEKLKFARVLKDHIDATPEPDPKSENQSDPKPSLFQSILLFLTPRDMATAFSLALALLFAGLSGLLFVRERSLRGEVEKLRAEKREIVEPVDPAKDPEAQRKLAEEQLARIEAELKLNRQKKEELERQLAQLEDKQRAAPDKARPRTSFQTPVLAMAVRSGEGEMAEIKVPEGYGVVKIALGLPAGEDGTYHATLHSEGKVLYSQGGLPVQEVDGKRIVLFGVPVNRLGVGEHRVRLTKAALVRSYSNGQPGARGFVGSYDFRRVR